MQKAKRSKARRSGWDRVNGTGGFHTWVCSVSSPVRDYARAIHPLEDIFEDSKDGSCQPMGASEASGVIGERKYIWDSIVYTG